jgi:excisionase family DNA binding protein
METALTSRQAARRAGLSRATIIRCFDRGLLHGFKLPGSRHRRIPVWDLDEFLREHGIPAAEQAAPEPAAAS